MSLNKSFNDTLNDWQALVVNLKPHLADLPNLAADHGTLSALVDPIRALQAQQDVHEASLRDVVSQRMLLAAQARKARNRLAAGLQSAFDHESDKLLEFGIKPRVRRGALRLTKLEKAQKAAERTATRAAELAAAQQPTVVSVPIAPTATPAAAAVK